MRPALYLLSSMLFDEPSPERFAAAGELIERLQEAGASHPLNGPLSRLAAALEWSPDLPGEYSRLFILGTPAVAAHPYGAYWLEGRLMGESTVWLTRQMECGGFAVDRASGLLPDHIVAELEFMACLADDDNPAARASLSAVFDSHLSRWAPQFTAALRRADPSPSPLYLAAADLLDVLMSPGGEARCTTTSPNSSPVFSRSAE